MRLTAIFIALCMLSILLGPDRVSADSGVLITSGHPEYAPFMWHEGDEIVGVGPDLVRMIFGELGIEVESPYTGPWKRVQQLGKAGEIDVISGMYRNKDRMTYMTYVEPPYSPDPFVVWVKKGHSFPFNSMEDLIGKRGITILGDSFGQEFDDFAKAHLDLKRAPKIEQNFLKILHDHADYMVCGYYPGLLESYKLGLADKVEILPTRLGSEFMFMAFSKKSKFIKHLPYARKRVEELERDGTVARLFKKHLDALERRYQHRQ